MSIDLVPVTADHKRALQLSPAALASELGVDLPAGWPTFPEAFADIDSTPPVPWCGYFFIDRSANLLVGNGGIVAPPDETGAVEIGYEIAPAFRGRGYATEAARALIGIAAANGAHAVIAHSLAETNASNAVMKKLGMHFVEAISNDEVGAVWQFRLDLR